MFGLPSRIESVDRVRSWRGDVPGWSWLATMTPERRGYLPTSRLVYGEFTPFPPAARHQVLCARFVTRRRWAEFVDNGGLWEIAPLAS